MPMWYNLFEAIYMEEYIMSIKLVMNRGNELVFDIDKIAKILCAGIHPINVTMSEKERQTYHFYIRIMAELGWPAYNDGDVDFHKHIVDLVETEEYEKVEDAIYNHYDAVYIKEFQEFLEDAPLINSERLPILREAFTLYSLGYYYGSVTLLISQIGGIAKDIERELLNKGVCFDSDNEKLLDSRYRVSRPSEKAKVIIALLESSKFNDEEGEHSYSIGYFRSIVFNEKLKGDDLLHHTSRHMVFHGDQLTFGTKEQALKLILCIVLIRFVCSFNSKTSN